MLASREDKVYSAKLAEQAERYDEMKQFMKEVAEMSDELSVEERNLLSVAYKNAVGARRASWRVVSTIEGKKRERSQLEYADAAQKYRQAIEVELHEICTGILNLLDTCLIPKATACESEVFFYKMKGDYYRYIAEFAEASAKQAATEEAKNAYAQATKVAADEHNGLAPTHPIRLGLALNYSVFFYEIIGDCSAACKMAKEAFDDAIHTLDAVSEDSYRDSTLIMHLLRDNLTLWNPTPEAGAALDAEPAEGAGAQPAAQPEAAAGGEPAQPVVPE